VVVLDPVVVTEAEEPVAYEESHTGTGSRESQDHHAFIPSTAGVRGRSRCCEAEGK
jgi:hypothetical protein